MTSEKDDFCKISSRKRNAWFNKQTSRFIFCQKLPICKISCRISNTMYDILQEILQSYPLLMSRKFETHGCQWYGVKRIKSSFADKGNSGTRFGAPLLLPQVVLISSIKLISILFKDHQACLLFNSLNQHNFSLHSFICKAITLKLGLQYVPFSPDQSRFSGLVLVSRQLNYFVPVNEFVSEF